MTVQAIPYMRKTVSDYLREHPDVAEITNRVVSNPPSGRSTPWIRVRRLDAPNATNAQVEHLVAFLMQFDCYAGAENGAPEADRLGRTVRAALVDMPGTHGDAVVTGTSIVGDIDLPDADGFEPARDRVILTARIWAHARQEEP